MIKVKMTEHYAGFEICGDYEDLNSLYDSINYLIRNESKSIAEEIMQNHVYNFLYDVRHAYQCSREYKLIENGLAEEDREWLGLKKRDVTGNNLYFKFYYMLPDLIEDIILIKYFISQVPKKDNNVYNIYINNVKLFYSQVIEALKEIVTLTQFNKINKGLLECTMLDTLFIPQWFDMISVDYANMNKDKRKKEIMHILDAIYNFSNYQDYFNLKKKIEKECKEKNRTLYDIQSDNEYPDEIEW